MGLAVDSHPQTPYTDQVMKVPQFPPMTKTIEISNIIEKYGNTVDASNLREYASEIGVTYQTVTKRLEQYKIKRGIWNLTVTEQLEQTFNQPAVEPVPQNPVSYIPDKDPNFVSSGLGNFTDIKKIIQSRKFYPAFITGLSGNGKTFSIEQACAQLKRELIRVNITIETDEDDLIGGFRLINGETVWHDGPVIQALTRGAVLLLDEIDLASNKILCLQSVLEGKGIFLKKIGKYVKPTVGFNVFATANTKGKGSDDGRFIGTNVLNEAFLERFPVTFEQSYPSPKVETAILKKLSESLGCYDQEFIDRLVSWSEIIRKTFYDGGVDEIISTRRLAHIIHAFSIFGKRQKAIQVCISRFDDETKQSFMELYSKIDASIDAPKQEGETIEIEISDESAPF
jgi:hypothetical protein